MNGKSKFKQPTHWCRFMRHGETSSPEIPREIGDVHLTEFCSGPGHRTPRLIFVPNESNHQAISTSPACAGPLIGSRGGRGFGRY